MGSSIEGGSSGSSVGEGNPKFSDDDAGSAGAGGNAVATGGAAGGQGGTAGTSGGAPAGGGSSAGASGEAADDRPLSSAATNCQNAVRSDLDALAGIYEVTDYRVNERGCRLDGAATKASPSPYLKLEVTSFYNAIWPYKCETQTSCGKEKFFQAWFQFALPAGLAAEGSIGQMPWRGICAWINWERHHLAKTDEGIVITSYRLKGEAPGITAEAECSVLKNQPQCHATAKVTDCDRISRLTAKRVGG